MFTNNQRKGLKAWVRYDGNNNAVAGSLIFQKTKPKVGKWKEYQDVNLCCPPQPPITRCTINSNGQPNPYSLGPYFSMQHNWTDPQYVFTLVSLNINGVEYANGETLTINNPADVQVGIGLDGRTYYTNTVDWINSLIPTSSKLVFYDDFNTVDHPENMLFQIIIADFPSGTAPGVYYYLGLLYYNSVGGPIPVTEIGWYSIGPGGTYKNCTNP